MRLGERTAGWLGPISIALLAFVLRIWHVGRPDRLMFDETYYAKHAWSLLQFGYVRAFTENADARIVDGQTTGIFAPGTTQIAHPEAGKWMIAIGEQIFGLTPFGWRIMAVIVGSLSVLVLARLVRRLTGSTWIGCLAGLLLALDGMAFVMSRIALLDGFLMFWLLCAAACLAADRDAMRERVEAGLGPLSWRPWQWAAGVSLGLALGTKWNALFVIAAFGLLVVGWEVAARRRREVRPGLIRLLLVVGTPAFGRLVIVAFVVYIATWTGWLAHHEVFAAQYDLGDGNRFTQLWRFHQVTFDFHTGSYLAEQTHPYQSSAWGWPILNRPVAVDAVNNLPASDCGAAATSSCLRVVTLLGNPFVWWPGAVLLVVGVVVWLRRRSAALGLGLVGALATWVPWLPPFGLDDRPIFSFYAIAMLPFTIIVACSLISLAWNAAGERGRRVLLTAVGVWIGTVVVGFWWFHPVWTDALLPYDTWRSRMWFDAWI